MPDHMITGPAKTPAAQRTIFGWAIVGPVSYNINPSVAIPTHFALGQTAEDKLDTLLSQFWEAEEPEQEPQSLSVVEEQVQAHYSETVVYDPPSCRYQVRERMSLHWETAELKPSPDSSRTRNPSSGEESGSHSRTWFRSTWI